MDKIYAYYSKNNGNIIEESLHEHIKNALNIIKYIERSKLGTYLQKRFPNVKNFYQISKTLIVFHDLGKVFYQIEPNKIYTHLSFKGHEFLSTFIFKKFNSYNKRLWFFNEIFGLDVVDPIKFAILFHHHAMNIRQREETLRELSINNLIKNTSLFDLLVIDVENFLEPEDRTPFKKALESIKKDILSQKEFFIANLRKEVEQELIDVWKNVWNNKNNKIFSLLLLNILLVADNMSASIKRGPSKSIFHQSLEDYYNNYFTTIQFI
ncbi:MAG: hypothetical protein N3F64_00720 [Nitrososphaeria archaeon]|nr:hypothetical protein [Nitrososphaeria archaeon]